MKSRSQGTKSVLIILVLILASGHPLINAAVPAEVMWPLLSALFGIFFIASGRGLNRHGLMVLLFYFALSIVHLLLFGFAIVAPSLGFLLMLCTAYLAVNLVDSFPKRFSQVMSGISAISLVVYALHLIGLTSPIDLSGMPGLSSSNGMIHIWMFILQDTGEVVRNAGPFWEPGAFAGYLNLALLIMLFGRGVGSRWWAAVLVLALISTMSTGGYVVFFVIALAWVARIAKSFRWGKRLIVLAAGISVLFVISLAASTELSFLREKIVHQYVATINQEGNYRITRFGSFNYDIGFVKQRPLFGWSQSLVPRSASDPEFGDVVLGNGNGLSSFAAKFGILGLIFYFWRVFQFGRQICGRTSESIMIVSIVCILFLGEQFLNFPVFWCLPLMPVLRRSATPI